jgi:hypothetical protein
VQIARGAVTLNDVPLSAGDGAAINKAIKFSIKALDDSEILVFDLA